MDIISFIDKAVKDYIDSDLKPDCSWAATDVNLFADYLKMRIITEYMDDRK